MTSDIAAAFLAAPPVAPNQAVALAEALARRFPGLGLPAPRIDVVEETRRDPPVPVLRLATRKRAYRYMFGAGRGDDRIDLVFLGYEYDGRIIDPASAPPELRHIENGRVIVRRRHYAAEAAFQRRLTGTGLLPTADFAKVKGEIKLPAFSFDHDAAAWADFVYNTVPALEQDGWRIEIEPEFRPRVVEGGGDWQASLGEGSGWWFSLDLGIEVDGERVPLLPVLTSLLRPAARSGRRESMRSRIGDVVFGQARRMAGMSRCRSTAPRRSSPRSSNCSIRRTCHADGTLGISMGEAVALAEIEAATRLRWLGGERLRALAERLRGFSGMRRVAPPAGLRRDVARLPAAGAGLAAVSARLELGGILADDMGLGKTVQTLAHVLVEKREGRLDRPASSSARPASCQLAGTRRRASRRSCGSCRCTAPTATALRRNRRRRSGADDLRAAAARRRDICCR